MEVEGRITGTFRGGDDDGKILGPTSGQDRVDGSFFDGQPTVVWGHLPEQLEPLSRIIKDLNDRFGTDFTDEDKVFIQRLENQLGSSEALKAAIRTNVPENARLTFDRVVSDELQDMVDTNFKFYKRVTDDPAFAKHFLDWLFDRFRKQVAVT